MFFPNKKNNNIRMLLITLLFLLIATAGAQDGEGFRRHGHYCGIYHYDSYGRHGIDQLDEYCKIHDICTSRGLMTCHCNYQLLKNVESLNKPDDSYQRSVIAYMKIATRNCNATDLSLFYIGKRSNYGFNYFEIKEGGAYYISHISPNLHHIKSKNLELFKYNAYYDRYEQKQSTILTIGRNEFRKHDLIINLDNEYKEMKIEKVLDASEIIYIILLFVIIIVSMCVFIMIGISLLSRFICEKNECLYH